MRKTFCLVLVLVIVSGFFGKSIVAKIMPSTLPLPLRIDVNSSLAITPNHLFSLAGQELSVTLQNDSLDWNELEAVNLRSERTFDWGDGSISVYWFGQTASHTWANPGIYNVKCKVVLSEYDGQVINVVSTLGMAQMVEQDLGGFSLRSGETKSWSVNGGNIIGVLVYEPSLTGDVCLMVNGTAGVNLCGWRSSSFEFPYASTSPVSVVNATLVGEGSFRVWGKTVIYYVPPGSEGNGGENLPGPAWVSLKTGVNGLRVRISNCGQPEQITGGVGEALWRFEVGWGNGTHWFEYWNGTGWYRWSEVEFRGSGLVPNRTIKFDLPF